MEQLTALANERGVRGRDKEGNKERLSCEFLIVRRRRAKIAAGERERERERHRRANEELPSHRTRNEAIIIKRNIFPRRVAGRGHGILCHDFERTDADVFQELSQRPTPPAPAPLFGDGHRLQRERGEGGRKRECLSKKDGRTEPRAEQASISRGRRSAKTPLNNRSPPPLSPPLMTRPSHATLIMVHATQGSN